MKGPGRVRSGFEVKREAFRTPSDPHVRSSRPPVPLWQAGAWCSRRPPADLLVKVWVNQGGEHGTCLASVTSAGPMQG